MNLQTGVIERPLTWLDVERQLKQSTALWNQLPAGVLAVDCFPDGMEVRHTGEASHVHSWLASVFSHSYSREQEAIRLRFVENMDYHEIGQVLEVNTQSAHNLVFRAMEKLRGWLLAGFFICQSGIFWK